MQAFLLSLMIGVSEATKPSIFFMLADDLGWNNLGKTVFLALYLTLYTNTPIHFALG